jgi:hypothetical protein
VALLFQALYARGSGREVRGDSTSIRSPEAPIGDQRYEGGESIGMLALFGMSAATGPFGRARLALLAIGGALLQLGSSSVHRSPSQKSSTTSSVRNVEPNPTG